MIKNYQIGSHTIPLEWNERVFEPNLTTKKIADEAAIPAAGACLDIGCGIGPLAAYAALEGANKVIAVDLHQEACELARKNMDALGIDEIVDIRCGHIYDVLDEGEKFSTIINDVSGMSASVAKLTPWYPETVKFADEHGINLTIEVIKNAKKYLLPDGVLYFPVISLSAYEKVHDVVHQEFPGSLKTHAFYRIPFPKELTNEIEYLEELESKSIISFSKKGRRYFWHLSVCSVSMSEH